MSRPKAKTLTKLQRRRLLNVIADFIEPLPKNKFDMSSFGIFPVWNAYLGKHEENKFHVPGMHNCNTAGCALGWAVSIPAVAAAGFGPKNFNLAQDIDWHEGVIELAAQTFAIDKDVAATVFGPGQRGHRTPTEVAANLRKVAKTGKLPAGIKTDIGWI